MILTVKINGQKEYRLSRWDSRSFNSNSILQVQSNDFAAVSNDFLEIEKIEIFSDENLIAAYNGFDTFENISFLGKIYVENEQKFADTFAITLTKANIMEIIDRIEGSISDSSANNDFDDFLNIVYNGEEE